MAIPMTDLADHAVRYARERAKIKQVDTQTGQLLLGLFVTHALPVSLLSKDNSLAHLRTKMDAYLERHPPLGPLEHRGDSPTFENALQLAEAEASRLGSAQITPENLILGIALEPNGGGSSLLIEVFKTDYVMLRQAIQRSQRSFA